MQGNPYDQNVGDAPGALTSLDEAVAIATTLLRQQPGNAVGSRALAWAYQSRSEVCFGTGRTQEAVTTMQSAAATLDELASRPGAKMMS